MNNFEKFKEYIEDSSKENNDNSINFIISESNNISSQNNLENNNYQKDSDYLSLMKKYNIPNINNSNNENMYNNISNKNIRDRIITKTDSNNEALTEQEITKINNDYTKQINEIISKNFKNGLDVSQNIYNNSYLNNNLNKENYLDLERERKLLLLKNIELEKEINNLNIFADMGNKYNYNTKPNKVLKSNSSIINNSKSTINSSQMPSKIKSYKNSNKNRNNNIKRNFKKEIIEAQNTIKDLDSRINQLKQEINKNYSMYNNKCNDKIKEIKIWRETFYEEYEKYKNLLRDLKENLNKDKILYNDVIWKMKQKASDNINIIYENYKNQIIENDKKLDFLRKENEKLINKENKVKEIYLYNFK